jgi:polysaccharide biosynthesis transport protein
LASEPSDESPQQENKRMSLIQFLRILWARKAILLAALLSCVIIAIIVSQILPKRYEATARVMLDTVTPDPVTGVTIGNQYRAFAKTQTELIQDEQTAGRVVDQLGWTSEPTFIADYAAATDGKGGDIRRWLAQRILAVTKARLVETSNIIEINYSSTSPDSAKKIADMIRQTYIDLTLEIRRKSAGRNADWYRDQADKAKELLVTTEAERSKFAKEHGIVLQQDNVDIESAKLNALSGQSASASATPTAGYIPPAPVSASTTQLEALDQQIAQAGQTLGPNHPSYQALLRQRSVIAGAAARERAAGTPRGPNVGAIVSQIQSAYEAQKSRVVGQRDNVDKLNQLNRDIDVKRDQYLKSAQRAADLRLQSTTAESGVSLLGEATVPDKPTYPNVPLILFGSFGFGGALGVCLALLIELLGRRVRSDEDLFYATKAPVFAMIGQRENGNAWYRRLARWFQDRAMSRRQAEMA